MSNEYDFDCAGLPASTNDTIGITHAPAFNFNPFGLEWAEFINLVCDFNAASTPSATATIQNENEIKRNTKVVKIDHKHKHKYEHQQLM